jgi:hypothetical protein
MAPRGTPVLSASNGRVLKLFNSVPGGLMVYAVDSTGRYILKYGHLDAYAPGLVDGQVLTRGQPIGEVGTTGNAKLATEDRGLVACQWCRLRIHDGWCEGGIRANRGRHARIYHVSDDNGRIATFRRWPEGLVGNR